MAQAVAADRERLVRNATDPGFPQACRLIEQLLARGGQARRLTARLAAGSGMNDLARVASEMAEAPPAAA